MSPENGQNESESPPTRVSRRIGSQWSRFNAWRTGRPFLGGILLCLGGVLITWVPMRILPDLAFIGGQMAGYLAIGSLFGVFVFLSGVYALYKPASADVIGVVGIVLSIFSLFGSLGGLLIGMLLGILGGNLCLAWKPGDEATDDDGSDPSVIDKAAARIDAGFDRLLGKIRLACRAGIERIKRRGIDE
ncbi:DUF6114 domain-containing protein [Halopiger djelfimassiliensis]|uniref:DUF6114 domain-containing protein n=1 Tax=Halopiger djelfimassiliensis TaxID=1293047 RepID=UPI0006781E48|nr:DUF6114 domain-containing protein [Halopiger djelfimassiliensis]